MSARTSATTAGKSSSTICRSETFTDTDRSRSGLSMRHSASRRQDSLNAQRPILMMAPVRSAMGMKVLGRTWPKVGECHRMSASKATVSVLDVEIRGWKAR